MNETYEKRQGERLPSNPFDSCLILIYLGTPWINYWQIQICFLYSWKYLFLRDFWVQWIQIWKKLRSFWVEYAYSEVWWLLGCGISSRLFLQILPDIISCHLSLESWFYYINSLQILGLNPHFQEQKNRWCIAAINIWCQHKHFSFLLYVERITSTFHYLLVLLSFTLNFWK